MPDGDGQLIDVVVLLYGHIDIGIVIVSIDIQLYVLAQTHKELQ